MSTFQKCPAEVHAMAREILEEFPSHEPLLLAGLKIDLLFALAETDDHGNKKGDALKLAGRKCLGIARRIKLKDRVMGRGDCEVSLDGDWWADASEADQRGLLDHELHHFVVEMDGERVVRDAIGRPVVRMRKHDFEFGWFEIIAARHGKHSQEVQQATMMVAASGKILFQGCFQFPEMDGAAAIAEPLRDLAKTLRDSGATMTLSTSGKEVHIDAQGAKNIIKTCDAILGDGECDEDEELIQQCIEVIKSEQKASISLLQRRLRLGYTRAARIMDDIERRGFVGPSKGAEPREILMEVKS